MQSLVYAPANCCLLLSRRVKLITKEIENNKYSSVSAVVSKNVWPYRFSHLRIIRLMNGFLLRKTINVLPIIHVDNVSSFEGKTEHILKYQSPTTSVKHIDFTNWNRNWVDLVVIMSYMNKRSNQKCIQKSVK